MQLRRPCQALKYGPSKDFAIESGRVASKTDSPKNEHTKSTPGLVRSPFNMTSNLKSEIGTCTKRSKDDTHQVNYETLLNYWNNN